MFTVGDVDASGKQLLDQIEDATAALLATVARLSDEDVRQPSRLPGWTRGHVLTHLARGGDALRDLLDGGPGYPSREVREEAIETGAGRSVAEHAADLRASAVAFREAVLNRPDETWSRPVTPPFGIPPFPASQVLVRRLVEIELHHVDLDAGYRPSDWPATFNELELAEPMRSQRADRIV
jgi:maleylpyruvate isomerase